MVKFKYLGSLSIQTVRGDKTGIEYVFLNGEAVEVNDEDVSQFDKNNPPYVRLDVKIEPKIEKNSKKEKGGR